MSRPTRAATAVVSAAFSTLLFTFSARSDDKSPTRHAGPSDRGFLLPNGWTLTPAGEQVALTDLPLNILPLADGRRALVATSGFNTHKLSLVDLVDKTIVADASVRQSWFGLALDEKAGKVWWSGGGSDLIHTFDLQGKSLNQTDKPPPPPRPSTAAAKTEPKPGPAPQSHFRSGLTLDRESKTLYTLDINAGTVTAKSLKGGRKPMTAPAGRRPYDVAFGRDGRQL